MMCIENFWIVKTAPGILPVSCACSSLHAMVIENAPDERKKEALNGKRNWFTWRPNIGDNICIRRSSKNFRVTNKWNPRDLWMAHIYRWDEFLTRYSSFLSIVYHSSGYIEHENALLQMNFQHYGYLHIFSPLIYYLTEFCYISSDLI